MAQRQAYLNIRVIGAWILERITSWLLVVGIIAHIVHMRIVERPLEAERGASKSYMVRLNSDQGLDTVAARLGVHLYNSAQVAQQTGEFIPASDVRSPAVLEQSQHQAERWLATLKEQPLKSDEVMAVANDFGRAELLMLRNTFQQPMMLVLYTLFVLSASFHAFNGLWTALITWGITLTDRSQRLLCVFCKGMMVLVAFLGLAAVWGTYWINLRQ